MVEELKKINICENECYCCTDQIYASMDTHARKWKEMEETIVAETPLHKAAAAGNTAVAVEILNLMPALGRKLNAEGLSPLHLAIKGTAETSAEAAEMYRGTVRALVRLDAGLVRVKGKGGVTPLMQCAAKVSSEEDEELLASLLLGCPESVKDVNNKHQTVVHVALAAKNCNVVCMLVDWLRRRDQMSSVLSVKDADGNTALHAAAQFGCLEGAKKLVDVVKLNRLNNRNQTPLDIAEDNDQTAVACELRTKGARNSSQIYSVETTTKYVLSPATFAEAFSRAYYYLTEELTLELRGAVLVVATLIVAATYQAVLQPPGGVYPPPPEESPAAAAPLNRLRHHNGVRLGSGEEAAWRQHLAGQMVMEKAHYRCFMPSNSFAFALSAVIIIFVVPGSPIFLILHVCLVFLCVSYLLALDAISYYSGISDMIFYLSLYAIVGAYVVKLFYYPVKALLVDEDWWLRRFGVKFANCSTRSSFWGSIGAMKTAERMKKQHLVLHL